MILFWLGFFALVAMLLVLDLGVLHRKAEVPSIASALGWTLAWVALGLSFSVVVYLIYENHWEGASLPSGGDGGDAAITYVSAYLLEQALSVDNLFVIAMVFGSFKVPTQHQHRVLFWGILGAIGFRLLMLSGGSYIANQFDWVFYIFGAYLAFQGAKLGRETLKDEGEAPENHPERSWLVRALRKVVPITGDDGSGSFFLKINGRRAVTTVFVCLVTVELTDIVFALDSIPAVMSVSRETFIMVTSNIFAILGLRSLYFVVAGAMAKFQYLKMALAVLLILIGVKMILGVGIPWTNIKYHFGHAETLGSIAGILGLGVAASIIATRREAKKAKRDA